MKRLLLIAFLTIFLAACGAQGKGTGPGMGMDGDGVMVRHHTDIPAEYTGLTNPVPADEASLERGAELYTVNCASCHGDGGMGDGPAASALNPAPAPVAQTSQMMGDDYLFWRISEGGIPFSTSMPSWKVLDEQARWDLVNYMHALGEGTIQPANDIGDVPFDATAQAAWQVELLAKAVDQGIITQAEADTFITVHNAVGQYRAEHPDVVNSDGNATERESAILTALVGKQIITQAQADVFTDTHDRLGASGLMP